MVLPAEHVVDEPARADLDVADLAEQLAGDQMQEGGRRKEEGACSALQDCRCKLPDLGA